MKNFAKNSLIKAKDHVKQNKFAYLWGVVAVGAIALQQSNNKAFYKFLVEKGINPVEYYCPEAYEEMKAS